MQVVMVLSISLFRSLCYSPLQYQPQRARVPMPMPAPRYAERLRGLCYTHKTPRIAASQHPCRLSPSQFAFPPHTRHIHEHASNNHAPPPRQLQSRRHAAYLLHAPVEPRDASQTRRARILLRNRHVSTL